MYYYIIRFISFIIVFTLIYNCSPRISRHGNIFSDDELKILQTTRLNKSEIIEILGQPSTKSTFSDNIWYYIFFIQKEKAYFQVKNSSNKVLKIKFDDEQNVETYNIIKNNQSIKIKTVKVNSDTSVFNRGIARELLDSFIRRMEEPTN
jgi:outer membrane protein assembly factor BamE (lipoprotein component of BamABCDE complex)